MNKKEISNWGNYPTIDAVSTELQFQKEIKDYVNQTDQFIARGNGRSYGDASLSEYIFSTKKLNKILSFDTEKGIIECESGMLLSEILNFSVPKGWFLSVSPGTKYISVGGAIGSDVHGKNHHSQGSFCDYVYAIKLVNENGDIIDVSKEDNSDLFWETCGGMGESGIILSAKFQLSKISSSYIKQKKIVTNSIEETISAFEKYNDLTFSVAWIDCITKGATSGKSIITFGEFASFDELPEKLKKNPLEMKDENKKINVPFYFPNFLLAKWSVKLFNLLYYHKEFKKEVDEFVHYESFFYPLDSLLNWNKIYGKNGFIQYQFVLPLEKDNTTLIKIFNKIIDNGEGSFLSVLKLLGKGNQSKYCFPMEGYTLALDFKVSEKIFKFLDELDEMIVEAGGRIYLTKDSRMKSSHFKKTYQKINKNNKFVSSQMKRLNKK